MGDVTDTGIINRQGLLFGDLATVNQVLERVANHPTDQFSEAPPPYRSRSGSITPIIGVGDFGREESLDEEDEELGRLLRAQTERARRATREEYLASRTPAERKAMEESLQRFRKREAEREARERQQSLERRRRFEIELANEPRRAYFLEGILPPPVHASHSNMPVNGPSPSRAEKQPVRRGRGRPRGKATGSKVEKLPNFKKIRSKALPSKQREDILAASISQEPLRDQVEPRTRRRVTGAPLELSLTKSKIPPLRRSSRVAAGKANEKLRALAPRRRTKPK